MPHPFKHARVVSHHQRQYGPSTLNEDPDTCEDAHFIVRVEPSGHGSYGQTYVGVADGVGSWRMHNVDPRDYSHRFIANAVHTIQTDSESRKFALASGGLGLTLADSEAIHPLDIIHDSWNATLSERVVGSCTILIATLDTSNNQLLYSNIGDCGLLVLRHEVEAGFRGGLARHSLRHNSQVDDAFYL